MLRKMTVDEEAGLMEVLQDVPMDPDEEDGEDGVLEEFFRRLARSSGFVYCGTLDDPDPGAEGLGEGWYWQSTSRKVIESVLHGLMVKDEEFTVVVGNLVTDVEHRRPAPLEVKIS